MKALQIMWAIITRPRKSLRIIGRNIKFDLLKKCEDNYKFFGSGMTNQLYWHGIIVLRRI